jgi:hypothetical protein
MKCSETLLMPVNVKPPPSPEICQPTELGVLTLPASARI